jgi:AmmeMemoRadiSam system protein B
VGTAKRAAAAAVTVPSQPTFFDAVSFASAINAAEEKIAAAERRKDVAAIVVPHHLLASSIIAEMFARASGREVDTVFIIGPNHQDVGPDAVATADLRYETALGGVASDAGLVESLRTELSASGSSAPFMTEHSIGAIAPFVQHYFNGAKVVPIAVSSFATREDAAKLARWLENNSGPRTLAVFSIDFSHYLTAEEAAKKDAETEKVIRARDIGAALAFGNDHVDSPGSLAAALEFSNSSGSKIRFAAHANANDFLPELAAATTSYFGLMFTVGR